MQKVAHFLADVSGRGGSESTVRVMFTIITFYVYNTTRSELASLAHSFADYTSQSESERDTTIRMNEALKCKTLCACMQNVEF